MAVEVASLVARLRADLSEFTPGLMAGKTEMKSFAATAEETGGVLGSVGKIAAAAGLALGAAEFIKSGIEDYMAYNKVQAQTAAALKSTSDASGMTAKGVSELADQIQSYSGQNRNAIQTTENLLLTFTGVKNQVGQGNDIFTQATKIAVDMGQALGTDSASGAIKLGKALNDPIKGITALTRVGVVFNQQQKDSIAQMVQTGNTMGAQKVILAELNKEFGGSAAAYGNTLPGELAKAKNAYEDLARSVVSVAAPAALTAASALADGLTKMGSKVEEFVHEHKGELEDYWNQWKAGVQKVVDALGAVKQPIESMIQSAIQVAESLRPLLQIAAELTFGALIVAATDAGAALRLLSDAVKIFADVLSNITPVLIGAAAAFAAWFIITKVVSGVESLYVALLLLKDAMAAESIAAFASKMSAMITPTNVAAAGIGLITTAYILMNNAVDNVNKSAQKEADAAAHTTSVHQNQYSTVKQLNQAYQANNSRLVDQLSIYDKLSPSSARFGDAGYKNLAVFQDLQKAQTANSEAGNQMITTIVSVGKSLGLNGNDVLALANKYNIDLTTGVTASVGALKGAIASHTDAGAAAKNLADAENKVGDALSASAGEADALKTALDGLNGNMVSAAQAQATYAKSVEGLSTSLVKGSRSLDSSTSAGQQNIAVLTKLAQGAEDAAVAQVKAGGSADQAVASWAKNQAALDAAAKAAGVNTQQYQALLAQYKFTPDQVTTVINANVTNAMNNVASFNGAANAAVAVPRTASINVNTAPASTAIAGFFAGDASAQAWLSHATGLGSAFASGLASGMGAGAIAAQAAAAKLAQNVIDGAKNKLRVQSPSKVARDIGGYFAQGLAHGIADQAHMAATAASNMAGAVIGATDLSGGTGGGTGAGIGLGGTLGGGSGTTIVVQVAGHVTTEQDLIAAIRAGLYKDQRNNGNLGFTP